MVGECGFGAESVRVFVEGGCLKVPNGRGRVFDGLFGRRGELWGYVMAGGSGVAARVEGLLIERLSWTLGGEGGVDFGRLGDVVVRERLKVFLREVPVRLRECGVCHRDVHPGNIMWSEGDGRWVLIDFAWACSVEEFGLGRHPACLNRFYSTDDGVACRMILEEVERWELGLKG